MSDCKIDAIKTKTILETSLFEVDEYNITLKSGRKVTHTVAKRNPTIAVIPLNEKNEVYLVKQYRYLLEQTTLETVAGFVDKGESPLQAAKRELKEETGIIAQHWEEIAKLEMSASVFKANMHIFLARDLELGEATPEEDEDIEIIKIPLKDAIVKIKTGEINTSASVSGLLLLENILK